MYRQAGGQQLDPAMLDHIAAMMRSSVMKCVCSAAASRQWILPAEAAATPSAPAAAAAVAPAQRCCRCRATWRREHADGPVAATSLPRPALYGSAIARFAFGDLYRSVQVENELRALERRARPVAAAAGRTHLAADMLHEDFITEGVQSAWPCATTRVLPAQSALFRRFHRCAERHGFLIEIAC